MWSGRHVTSSSAILGLTCCRESGSRFPEGESKRRIVSCASKNIILSYYGGGFSRVAHSAIPPLTDLRRFRIPLRLKTIKDVHFVSAYNWLGIQSRTNYIGIFSLKNEKSHTTLLQNVLYFCQF